MQNYGMQLLEGNNQAELGAAKPLVPDDAFVICAALLKVLGFIFTIIIIIARTLSLSRCFVVLVRHKGANTQRAGR